MVAGVARQALLFVVLALLVGASEALPQPVPAAIPAPAVGGGLSAAPRVGSTFRNLDPSYHRASLWARARSLIVGGTWLVGERRVVPLPIVHPDLTALRANSSRATATWIGHATVLVQLDGVNFLTDPIWASRSGPFGGLVGVGRYTPPAIAFDDLPRIDFVLISHDHYDHLDEPTVRHLARQFNPRFVVPLGIKAWLEDRGIRNVVELSWGESVRIGGVTVVCTPAQHGSGRTLVDQGRRLWASWAVLGTKRFYFAGDTGYYEHFKEIGAALGPFDLAALPIGSYTPRALARPVHMSPEEALQAWQDLHATKFLGIHWGTFALAREPYDEPPRRIAEEVVRRHLDADSVWILPPGATAAW
ncbi:MAG: metallohydrolase [Candidatus Rokuibacteriota bacterium]|nr:MAG: metallohydrolase [Candidatus Rokubacteria bacterium]